MSQTLVQYQRFMQEVDLRCKKLSFLYQHHLCCRAGCTACCTAISVLAIEGYSILRGVRKDLHTSSTENQSPTPDTEAERCVFLDSTGACRVYPYRPLICRTHGLPLLYQVEEYGEDGRKRTIEDPEWQLFYCDLNFQGVAEDEWEQVFPAENIINMEEWNERLVQINEWFRGSNEGMEFLYSIRQGNYGKYAQKELYQTGRVPLSSLGWFLF